jgi:hypothetical protein
MREGYRLKILWNKKFQRPLGFEKLKPPEKLVRDRAEIRPLRPDGSANTWFSGPHLAGFASTT